MAEGRRNVKPARPWYFDVDLNVVWQTAADSIAQFAIQVRRVLERS